MKKTNIIKRFLAIVCALFIIVSKICPAAEATEAFASETTPERLEDMAVREQLRQASVSRNDAPAEAANETDSDNDSEAEPETATEPETDPEQNTIRVKLSYFMDEDGIMTLSGADRIHEDKQTAYFNSDIALKLDFCGCEREELAAVSVVQCTNGIPVDLYSEGELQNAELEEVRSEDGSLHFVLELLVTEDGFYQMQIAAKEGVLLEVLETDPAGNTEDAVRAASYTSPWTLVRDTVRPRLTSLVITPEEGVAHPELNTEYGNRYYFNKGFSATAEVEDANLAADPEDNHLRFLRAEDTADTNSEEVVFSEGASFSKEAVYSCDGEKAVFADAVTADGVYAYALTGADLAGNPVELGENVDGVSVMLPDDAGVEYEAIISRYVVVDTLAPTGVLTITAGGREVYTRATGEEDPTYSMPYQPADSAMIKLAADETERTPVKVTLGVEEKSGTKVSSAESEGFIFHGTAVKNIDERMIFRVTEGVIEDLAGNRSGGVSSRRIYLDREQESDHKDSIAPVIDISPVIKDNEYGNEGRPLYKGEAQFTISVVEPLSPADGTLEADRASSGLKSVSWKVIEKMTGTSVLASAGELYRHASEVREGGHEFADENALIYAFDNGKKALKVPANARTNRNDLCLVLTAEDNAGNVRTTSCDFGIDVTAPAVTIAYDNNDVRTGRYFNAPRTATVTVTERNFDPDGIHIEIFAKDRTGNENRSLFSLGGWSARKKDAGAANGDRDTFVREIRFTGDGEFAVSVGPVLDAAGNEGSVRYDDAAAAGTGFVIDTKAPTVSIRMDDGFVSPAADGAYYYRADNCGFRVVCEDDGALAAFSAELSGGRSKSWPADSAGDDEALVFTAEEVSASGDGAHTVSVAAVDAAGNAAESIDLESSFGCAIRGLAGSFVLDTKPPTFSLSIGSPASVNRSLNREQGGRYYFNSAFTARVQVRDANFDADRITVRRGRVTDGLYDSSAVRITSYSEAVPNVKHENTGAATVNFTDTVSADGVYRYAVYGSDKAGNALVAAQGSANLDGTDTTVVNRAEEEKRGSLERAADISCHIVADTVQPAGVVSIMNASGFEYYRMLTNGNVEKAEPYRDERSAKVKLSVDVNTERTPVKLDYWVTAQPSSKSLGGTTRTFAYNNALTVPIDGRQQFKVEKYTLTDLAGNAVTVSSGNFIYLDQDDLPVQDRLAPVTAIRASAPASVRGGRGQDLFDGDVTLSLKITDPYKGQSSSGLGDIYYEVFVNESKVLSDTTVLHTKNTEPMANNYRDPSLDYVFERNVTIPAASHNDNNIRFVVTAYDNAGNCSKNEYRFGIDVTPPSVRVRYDNNDVRNGKYFNAERIAEVTVIERNFDPAGVNISTQAAAAISGWTLTAGASANGDDDAWTCTIMYRTDGKYTFSVSAADLPGWSAGAAEYSGVAPQDFVIDRTAPVLSVSYDNNDAANGRYFKADRTAVLSVSDANFEGANDVSVTAHEGGSVQGGSFSGNEAKLPFTTDGVYSFGGTVTDMAGNVSNRIDEGTFVIDKTLPEVTLSGVEDLSANAEALTIILAMADRNLDEKSTSVLLSGTARGECHADGSRMRDDGIRYVLEVAEDDYYRLTYTAADLAGNTVTKTISFSENQNGAVFAFLGPIDENGYAGERFTPEYILTDVDAVTILSVTMNGREVPYDYADDRLIFREALPSDGKYVLTVDVTDTAGNRRTDRREFIVDTKVPRLTVMGLSKNNLYFEPFVITLRRESLTDKFLEIWMDGEELTEGDGPGQYRVGENGDAYIAVSEYGAHELYVKVRDEAGNVTMWPEQDPGILAQILAKSSVSARSAVRETRAYEFRLTDSIFLRWYSNKPVFFISLAIIGVLVFIFLRLLRHKNNRHFPSNRL